MMHHFLLTNKEYGLAYARQAEYLLIDKEW